MVNYCDRIRALREDNDLTQAKVAKLQHVGQKTYSDYELGKTRIPIDRLITLAEFYSVSMDYICGLNDSLSHNLKQDISIGKNLKRLRKNAGLTQDQASAQLEIMGLPITASILSKMEQGRYSVRISILLAMKKIYHVKTFDEFFEGLEQP